MDCLICKRSINGAYYESSWGEQWCDTHQAQQCPHCGHLVLSVISKRFAAGNPICEFCTPTAVAQSQVAAGRSGMIKNWLASEGLLTPTYIPVSLVPTLEHVAIDGQTSMNLHGVAHAVTTESRGGTTLQSVRIEIVSGLPLDLFLGVLAHEMTHTFLYLQNVQGWTPCETEGLCETVSYRWYRMRGGERNLYFADKIATNPDPIYGAGFRAVQEKIERFGWQRTVSAVRANGRLP